MASDEARRSGVASLGLAPTKYPPVAAFVPRSSLCPSTADEALFACSRYVLLLRILQSAVPALVMGNASRRTVGSRRMVGGQTDTPLAAWLGLGRSAHAATIVIVAQQRLRR